MNSPQHSFNIVYIHTHDTGRYVSPHGYPVETPNLHALAAQSVLFRNAHSSAPTCSPSRSSLLTGTYPHENGMLGLAHRGFSLYDYRQHLVSYLKSAGYTTALCGVQHVAPRKGMIGYDLVLDDSDEYFEQGIDDLCTYDQQNARCAAEFIRTHEDGPFFLSFGMLNTHRPFPEPSETGGAYARPPCPIPDTADTRKDAAGFYTAVKTVDQCVGEVLEALRSSGREEDTLVLCTSDHGPAFPGMKATLHDSGTGVVMMLKLPEAMGRTTVDSPPMPQVCDAMVSQLDIFPTLSEMLGIPPQHSLEGRSLLPLLRGEQQELHPYLYSETSFHAAYEPARAIRSKRYKLIRRYSPIDHRLPVNVDDSPTKDHFSMHGYFSETAAGEELFDLALDPLEKQNSADDSAYRSVREELGAHLNRWMERTGDTLLKGPVKPPAGAALDSPESYSPD